MWLTEPCVLFSLTWITTTNLCIVCPRYSTAYAESDYTDRDTDREEAEREPEQESEEDEDKSCATVLTLRQEDSQDEEVEERGLDEREEEEDEDDDEGRLQLLTEVPSGELALLLAQSDILHTGDASLKAEGFRLLVDNRAEVSNRILTHSSLDPNILPMIFFSLRKLYNFQFSNSDVRCCCFLFFPCVMQGFRTPVGGRGVSCYWTFLTSDYVVLILHLQYGHSREFLWRLARAYSDMYKSSEDKQEKKTYAQKGKEQFLHESQSIQGDYIDVGQISVIHVNGGKSKTSASTELHQYCRGHELSSFCIHWQ